MAQIGHRIQISQTIKSLSENREILIKLLISMENYIKPTLAQTEKQIMKFTIQTTEMQMNMLTLTLMQLLGIR